MTSSGFPLPRLLAAACLALAAILSAAPMVHAQAPLVVVPAQAAQPAEPPAALPDAATVDAPAAADRVQAAPALPTAPAAPNAAPLVTLGLGDSVALVVYGKPDLSVTVEVGEDGTILLPLIGAVKVAGLSPAEASALVARRYQDGEFLVNPQVAMTISKAVSQQVAVLGQVGNPGRYPVESRTTVFDLLASAGGKTVDGAETIVLVRTEADGTVVRTPIDLGALADPTKDFPTIQFRGGDTLYVPRAEQIFIYGEVASPGKFPLQPGTTLIQALTVAGGVTRRGSLSRIEIKRRRPDGSFQTLSPKLNDPVQADDVVRVKESIF